MITQVISLFGKGGGSEKSRLKIDAGLWCWSRSAAAVIWKGNSFCTVA